MSINKVMITGNLTRDPELRATGIGTQILHFGVAVNDRRRPRRTSLSFSHQGLEGRHRRQASLQLLGGQGGRPPQQARGRRRRPGLPLPEGRPAAGPGLSGPRSAAVCPGQPGLSGLGSRVCGAYARCPSRPDPAPGGRLRRGHPVLIIPAVPAPRGTLGTANRKATRHGSAEARFSAPAASQVLPVLQGAD